MANILNKLNSANYVTVRVTDNAVINGNNLLSAYADAKTKSPNGSAKSETNRIAIILPTARYDLGVQSLTLDTQFIDIIGNTSDRDSANGNIPAKKEPTNIVKHKKTSMNTPSISLHCF